MIIKNYEGLNAIKALSDILKIDLPVKLSWNLSRNLKNLTNSIKDYEKFEHELVKKYAEKDSKLQVLINENGQYCIPKEKIILFKNEKEELLNLETDVNILKISISDFNDVYIKGESLIGIDFMIEDFYK